jgi:integrase
MGEADENPVIAGGACKAAARAANNRVVANRQKKDYSQEELQLIFSSPIYTHAKWASPRANFGAAWYWMPLLMYYTGARREELAQLAAKDVLSSKEDGWHLSILALDDDDDAGRSVKTAGSRRFIPIHPDLIELGFLRYATALESGQLFPLLKQNPDGYYGANFGKRWASYLRDTVGLRTRASPSHGFRHTFKTLCRQVGIAEDVSDAITGHAGGNSVARDYGGMPLSRMAEEIKRFPSAPLSKP